MSEPQAKRCSICGHPLILTETQILGKCLECLKKETSPRKPQVTEKAQPKNLAIFKDWLSMNRWISIEHAIPAWKRDEILEKVSEILGVSLAEYKRLEAKDVEYAKLVFAQAKEYAEKMAEKDKDIQKLEAENKELKTDLANLMDECVTQKGQLLAIKQVKSIIDTEIEQPHLPRKECLQMISDRLGVLLKEAKNK